MKKSIFGVAFLAVLVAVFGFTNLALALDPTLKQLPPNSLFERFWRDLDQKVISGEIESLQTVNYFEDAEDEYAKDFINLYTRGIFNANTPSSSLLENADTLNLMEDTFTNQVTEMGVVSLDGDVFVKFVDAVNKKVRNKWIEVPADKYKKLGEALNLKDFFEDNLPEKLTDKERKLLNTELALARKHNLFVFYPEINDGKKVKNATRFNLEYNPLAIVPYVTELKKTMTAEDLEDTILIPLPEIADLDKRVLNYISEKSYISLWFDDKTSLPSGIAIYVMVPSTFGDSGFIDVRIDMIFTKINQPVNIKRPAKTITFEEGLKAFNIPTNDFITPPTPEELEIRDLIYQYQNAKSKIEKADYSYDIAMAYEAIYKDKEAAEYYKISAANEKKNSEYYYEALAQAEWTLGNGLKAKEYLEKAYAKNPNDELVLDSYGYFLLGMSKTTYQYQNLQLALKLNENLVAKLVDDYTLISLYLNHILLGNNAKAEEIKARFDHFATGENYNLIARAYHRMGNIAQRERYAKMAKDLGYIRDKWDNEFFALTFK